jgi:sulfur-carrier protein adenylyltransferase/sulfurtransferase
MCLYEKARPHVDGYREVSVQQVAQLGRRGDVRLIDVREPDEWRGELWHLEGAQLVSLHLLPTFALHEPKDIPTVLICRSGVRSAKAARLLHELGFTKVMNMTGGMLAWSAAKLSPALPASP